VRRTAPRIRERRVRSREDRFHRRYDVVLCTFDGQPRLLILLAKAERRSHDPACVDFVPTIGLTGEATID
jgi:hypothetical protein